MNNRITLDSEEAMLTFGSLIAKYLSPGNLIYLEGELGTGKTTIARGILQGLGHTGTAPSPTYTLIETYNLPTAFIVHADLYRIKSFQDVEGIGFRDYFNGETIVLVEWTDKFYSELSSPDLRLSLLATERGRIVRIEEDKLNITNLCK